jgi:hypothetical protein
LLLRVEINPLRAAFPENPAAPKAPAQPPVARKLYQGISLYAFSDSSDTAKIIIDDTTVRCNNHRIHTNRTRLHDHGPSRSTGTVKLATHCQSTEHECPGRIAVHHKGDAAHCYSAKEKQFDIVSIEKDSKSYQNGEET